ncbi:hypothetical protein SEA_BRUHMOMENT_93 [Arthrobacter phage BruhMoment]|nr:hypothetical protein SEA_BRUHMOMENT_93 [Arthrobacter phage BruhMoment]
MTPTLEATQTGEDTYTVAVRPDQGIPVVLYVVPAIEQRGRRWYVRRDPQSAGHISYHTSFESAAKSATSRAKRYLASYARTAKRRAVA